MVSRLFSLGGGHYYYGTKACPEGSYCRYFSDCKFPFISSFLFLPTTGSPSRFCTLIWSLLNEHHRSHLYSSIQGIRNVPPTTTKSCHTSFASL